jgi:hypothetical protein
MASFYKKGHDVMTIGCSVGDPTKDKGREMEWRRMSLGEAGTGLKMGWGGDWEACRERLNYCLNVLCE